jgi:hypothetical protein
MSYIELQLFNHRRSFHFALNLVQPENENLGLRKSKPVGEVRLPTLAFSKMCRELAEITETARFELKSSEFVVSVLNEQSHGSVNFKPLPNSITNEIVIKTKERLEQAFSLRFLNSFNRAGNLCDTVHLKFSEKFPMQVIFRFDIGSLKFFLAPMIQ